MRMRLGWDVTQSVRLHQMISIRSPHGKAGFPLRRCVGAEARMPTDFIRGMHKRQTWRRQGSYTDEE